MIIKALNRGFGDENKDKIAKLSRGFIRKNLDKASYGSSIADMVMNEMVIYMDSATGYNVMRYVPDIDCEEVVVRNTDGNTTVYRCMDDSNIISVPHNIDKEWLRNTDIDEDIVDNILTEYPSTIVDFRKINTESLHNSCMINRTHIYAPVQVHIMDNNGNYSIDSTDESILEYTLETPDYLDILTSCAYIKTYQELCAFASYLVKTILYLDMFNVNYVSINMITYCVASTVLYDWLQEYFEVYIDTDITKAIQKEWQGTIHEDEFSTYLSNVECTTEPLLEHYVGYMIKYIYDNEIK